MALCSCSLNSECVLKLASIFTLRCFQVLKSGNSYGSSAWDMWCLAGMFSSSSIMHVNIQHICHMLFLEELLIAYICWSVSLSHPGISVR